MTLTKPSLPVLAVVLIFLAPLILVAPWAFLVAAPVVVVALLVFGVPTLAAREVIAEKAPEGVEVMCLDGLEKNPEVAARIRGEINTLFADTPPEKDPVACACVTQQGEQWLGVLRMRTTDGHSYTQVEGATPAEAGDRMAEAIQGYQRRFPVLQPEPVSYQECQSDCCHLGRKSIFYIDRDKFGRPHKHG